MQTLLRRVPGLKCMVIPRERPAIAGEYPLLVPPLPVPDRSETPTAEKVSGFAEVQLFTDRARATRADFQAALWNASAVAELCAALDGIPLSLDLAGALSQILSPAQMRLRLSRRFELPATRKTDREHRHRSLWATLAWSHDLLPPETQRFFARLSVFRGGWTEEEAAVVREEPRARPLVAAQGTLACYQPGDE